MDRERRAQLLLGKLRALVNDRFGELSLEPVPYFAGVGAFDASSSRLFVLVEAAQVDRDPLDIDRTGPRPPHGWLGGAIVAAARRSATELHLLGDDLLLTGDDARRAARCTIATTCWSVVGRTLIEVVPSVAPSANNATVDLPDDERAFVTVIEAAGAVALVEHGVLRAEVLGLEVGRVVRDPETDEPQLAVGVGTHDRLAQSMMHAGMDPATTLRDAIASIREHRIPGAPAHPANVIARSRWLREIMIEHPERFGLSGPCRRLSPTVVSDLKAPLVAAFTAHRPNGMPVVVGCSVGIDLDAPTFLLDVAGVEADEARDARDARDARETPFPDVLLAVPTADDLPALRALCETLTPIPGIQTVGAPFSQAE
jgi:hypothetical protein